MDSKHKHLISQIEKQKKLLLTNDKMGVLSELLNSEECQWIIENCREFRDRVYNPLRTLCAFIKQILHSDKSCKNAVSGVLVDCVVNNEEKPSENTGSYCKARARFPEEAIARLVTEIGGAAVKNAKHSWKWNGREVKLADGTTLLMPDTKANQAAFPQHKNQKKGVGFPILRLVVIMSLTVGTIIGYAASAFKGKGTGEQSLLRSIFASCINKLDVLLGDRYYPCFFCLLICSRRVLMVFSAVKVSGIMIFARGFSLEKKTILWTGKSHRNRIGWNKQPMMLTRMTFGSGNLK